MYYQNEQNTFSTTYPDYDDQLYLFRKPEPVLPKLKGSFVRKEEYQRQPFFLPGFNFENPEPPPLGLPQDRLALLLDERKKTPAEIRELVKGIITGPQPDLSVPGFQSFVYRLYTKMVSQDYYYPQDHAVKLIQDLVIKQPELLDANPSKQQSQLRQTYIDTKIKAYMRDDTGNVTTELELVADNVSGMNDARTLDLINARFHPTSLRPLNYPAWVGPNPPSTYDRPDTKGPVPSYRFLLDQKAFSDTFHILTNLDRVLQYHEDWQPGDPTLQNYLTGLIPDVFKQDPTDAAGLTPNVMGNLELKDNPLIWFLEFTRPQPDRVEFCKALFLEALTFNVEKTLYNTQKAQFQEMLGRFRRLRFNIPLPQLMLDLVQVYARIETTTVNQAALAAQQAAVQHAVANANAAVQAAMLAQQNAAANPAQVNAAQVAQLIQAAVDAQNAARDAQTALTTMQTLVVQQQQQHQLAAAQPVVGGPVPGVPPPGGPQASVSVGSSPNPSAVTVQSPPKASAVTVQSPPKASAVAGQRRPKVSAVDGQPPTIDPHALATAKVKLAQQKLAEVREEVKKNQIALTDARRKSNESFTNRSMTDYHHWNRKITECKNRGVHLEAEEKEVTQEEKHARGIEALWSSFKVGNDLILRQLGSTVLDSSSPAKTSSLQSVRNRMSPAPSTDTTQTATSPTKLSPKLLELTVSCTLLENRLASLTPRLSTISEDFGNLSVGEFLTYDEAAEGVVSESKQPSDNPMWAALAHISRIDKVLNLMVPSRTAKPRLSSLESWVALKKPDWFGFTKDEVTQAVMNVDEKESTVTLFERIRDGYGSDSLVDRQIANYLDPMMNTLSMTLVSPDWADVRLHLAAFIQTRQGGGGLAGNGVVSLAGNGVVSKSLGHILNKFAVPDETQSTSRSLGRLMWKARQSPSYIQSLSKKPKL
jgi:hypothetical protein